MASQQVSTMGEIEKGLSSTEKFIALMRQLISVAFPDYHGCAKALEDICRRLFDANASLVGWINSFADFDFTDPTATPRFITLAGKYQELKTGKNFKQLKFDCHEIETVYNQYISGKLRELFGGERRDEAETIFRALCNADAMLVRVIHTEIFVSLDGICGSLLGEIEDNDLDGAEECRLKFKAELRDLITRLQAIGNNLTDLLLAFRKATRT